MSEEQKYPSYDEQTKNFLRSVTDVIQGMMRGQEVYASRELREKRQEICNGCDKLDVVQGRCTACGCFLKGKIPFAASECPEMKWGMDNLAIEEEVLRRVQK